MSSFWNNLYDRHKDRRYATIFLVTLFAFFGLALTAVFLYFQTTAFDALFTYFLPGLSVLIPALVWMVVRLALVKPEKPPPFSPLSRDERHKARSKLKSSFRSPPAKAPDTNLRY